MEEDKEKAHYSEIMMKFEAIMSNCLNMNIGWTSSAKETHVRRLIMMRHSWQRNGTTITKAE